jgi:membrane protein implicated in regulation of membrane protease activity
MEGSIVQSSISVERKREGKKHAFDDILYLLMGDATIGNAIILVLTIIFFGTTPVVLILLFANYIGGMRWLLSLAIVTALGILALYLMKRGMKRKRKFDNKEEVQTEFPGQLTEVTDAVERGSIGYVYSQQLMRERLCEAIINKLALARDLSADEIITKLEKEDTEFIGDEILEIFLLDNRRGTKGWDETQLAGKGKSAERGKKFMIEIEVILDRIEEII